ncbi:hypothetical protein BGX31_011663 [Mortierella sp. GBA43]|nr:hypothetical protein BGX31_011663 [Mortierella sp. GBA43]
MALPPTKAPRIKMLSFASGDRFHPWDNPGNMIKPSSSLWTKLTAAMALPVALAAPLPSTHDDPSQILEHNYGKALERPDYQDRVLQEMDMPHRERRSDKVSHSTNADKKAYNQTCQTSVVDYAWIPWHDLWRRHQDEQIPDAAIEMQASSGPMVYLKVPKVATTIFYVPHQDDDAIAMALSIREHIEAGRRVIVHLYSDGINPLLRDIVAGVKPCTINHPPHKFNLTILDEIGGRTHEFRNSIIAMGVPPEDIVETGWSDVEPIQNYKGFKAKLRDLIIEYETKYPGASHKCITQEYDPVTHASNPTHHACWDVATDLLHQYPHGWPASRQLWDFRFYRTYTFSQPVHNRTAQYICNLPQFLRFKQLALDQYKKWDPAHGELAWGYHSVPGLINASYSDPHLYMDMLDNDPVNPHNWATRVPSSHRKHVMGSRVLMEQLGQAVMIANKQPKSRATWSEELLDETMIRLLVKTAAKAMHD